MIAFFDERQSVPDVDSFSPSAGKPERLMRRIQEPGALAFELPVRGFEPVTIDDLRRVHDARFVEGVFEGQRPNGFCNTDPRVPQACLWTIGSLVAATLHAERHAQPAFSPSSGFHHAHWDEAEGYCTFNGLMVAADQLLQRRPHATVGILDCDVHYGNGTDDILRHHPQLASRIVHHTSGRYFHEDADPEEFFLWLQESIADLNASGCDVVIYQAGADMHKSDPLGGFLTDAQMRQRDRTVFRKVRCGLAWNLAGGYRRDRAGSIEPVLQTHLATLHEAHAARSIRDKFFKEREARHASH